MKQRPEIAVTEMLLCNDADIPLLFKLCSDTSSSITATPAGSGCIPPRAEQRCFLTWRRSKQIQQDIKAPKLILITNFVEQEIDDNQTVVTKLIARIHSEEKARGEIPLMKFTFERKEITSPSETLNFRTDNVAAQPIEMDYARVEALKKLNHFIQWFQRHPLETMMLLLFFIALFVAIFD
ncbi:unnamed protein product [Cercopithifilaria johnstoni]|uniref:Uncharacterized protein n=1 Tax=Cercopithifilaria johnstoni TaxID=2874296 RepID=A0A8J2MKZ4_9BILA|nr:unnamed protein product [Cercopithifilaria johnstoni]